MKKALNAGCLKKLLSNIPNNAEIILQEGKEKRQVPIKDAFTKNERDIEGRKLSKVIIVFDNF